MVGVVTGVVVELLVAVKESVFEGVVVVVLSLNTTVLLLRIGTGIYGMTGRTTGSVAVTLADMAGEVVSAGPGCVLTVVVFVLVVFVGDVVGVVVG